MLRFQNRSGLSAKRVQQLRVFERDNGLRLKDLELLNLAFTHRSFANEGNARKENNERLEFLGDSILGLVVAEYLFDKLQTKPEGDLARVKSFVVSEHVLASVASELGVDTCLLLGRGEENSGGRGKKAILADTVEAVIAAIYLDRGLEVAKRFILSFIVAEIDRVLAGRHEKDYKTLLQELVQKRYRSYPRYTLIKKTGPEHDRRFWMQVSIEEREYGPGIARSKKDAERAAAELAYHDLSGE